LQALRPEDDLAVGGADLDLVTAAVPEALLQPLPEPRVAARLLDLLRQFGELPPESRVEPGPELVPHHHVDGRPEEGEHGGEHGPIPEGHLDADPHGEACSLTA